MRTADNLNGTFTNPVIFADYPDPDVIRVGEDYYLASSSFTDTPGIPICHSRDLVNWRVIGHVYDRLPESNPAYSMTDGQTAYRGGSWAPSLRYHAGRFYVAFCTPAEGFCLARSIHPAGPYELTWFEGRELYDPGLFFDDDDRVYVAHGANDIFLTELSADALSISSDPYFLYGTAYGNPLEGSHVYKYRGWYFICNTCRAYNGLQVVYRSRQLHGPYESRLLTADDLNYAGAGLHQGGLVDLPNGDLWFCLFQDRDYLGRVPILIPARWGEDDWPVLGDPNNFGRIPITVVKPLVDTNAVPCTTEGSDEFDHAELGLQWRWNHNADDSRWSLSQRPGWLRLGSGPATDLLHARNTLTQKITGGGCSATTRLDASALLAGDLAGVCVLGFPYAFIAVERTAQGLRLLVVNNGSQVAETATMDGRIFYLCAEADASGLARFSFSPDGKLFSPLGDDLVMQFSVQSFLGNKFGLFCFNPHRDVPGGYADFDYLHYRCSRGPANHFQAGEIIPAVAYDAERGVDTLRLAEKRPAQALVCLHDGDWVRFDHIDCGTGVDFITIYLQALDPGGKIELRLGGPSGQLHASLSVSGSGETRPWRAPWEVRTWAIPMLTGIQTICLRMCGCMGELMRLEYFTFSASQCPTAIHRRNLPD